MNVRQTIASTADVDYKNTDGPSGYLEAGYMSSKGAGVVASYKRTPGEVRVDNYPVNQRDFVWEWYSAEGLLQLPWRTQVIGKPVNWGLRMGFQYHQFPFLFVGQNLALNQTSNNMLTGSFGFYSETEGRLKYYWTMRYQQPVRS